MNWEPTKIESNPSPDLTELVLSFLNSPDLAQHFRKEGRVFDLLEAATLVNASFRPWAAKREAWSQLLKGLPDLSLPKSFHHPAIPSLRQKIVDLLDLDEAIWTEFQRPSPNAVYTFELFRDCNSLTRDFNWGNQVVSSQAIFRSLPAAEAAAARKLADWAASDENSNDGDSSGDSDNSRDNSSSRDNDSFGLSETISLYQITRTWLDSDTRIIARLNRHHEVLELTPLINPNFPPPASMGDFKSPIDSFLTLSEFLFDYPLKVTCPFERGDVVERLIRPGETETMVLAKKPAPHGWSADLSDLDFSHYHLRQGALNRDVNCPYIDLRARQSPGTSEGEILDQVGAWLKGQIGLDKLTLAKKIFDLKNKRRLVPGIDWDIEFFFSRLAAGEFASDAKSSAWEREGY
ncbi:MAG: hypothetical protein LBR11_10065 [Deltaproteobacteria bacterium]|jgi:hypothetical protein|nr:hypothetical protein [Deltaproteobacteria bacterium]